MIFVVVFMLACIAILLVTIIVLWYYCSMLDDEDLRAMLHLQDD